MFSLLVLTTNNAGVRIVDSWCAAEWVLNKFWPLTWCISLLISQCTNTKSHSIWLFFTTTSMMKKMFFQSMYWKRYVWHTDASSVVWTPIDNGKLANQIVRLVTIVVKKLVNCRLTAGCDVNGVLTEVLMECQSSIARVLIEGWSRVSIKGVDQGNWSRVLIKGVDRLLTEDAFSAHNYWTLGVRHRINA